MQRDLNEIITASGRFDGCGEFDFVPFKSCEDGSDYEVWLVSSRKNQDRFVIKRVKEGELSAYENYLSNVSGVPRFLGKIEYGDEQYLMIEYIDGDPALHLTRQRLVKIINALASVQNKFWEHSEICACGVSFDESLKGRIDRGKYLFDIELEAAYGKFLEVYEVLPRTLCHDDLLPFNVLVNNDRAVIIDWESVGILPYPVSIARLLAHAENTQNSLFRISDEDRDFAEKYYYELVAKPYGIAYDDYKKHLSLFYFYEYCEWIMLGNKYDDADMDRFKKYGEKAKKLLKNIT